jgi:hypothetical protein
MDNLLFPIAFTLLVEKADKEDSGSLGVVRRGYRLAKVRPT